jgi:hypothetical protein
MWMWMWMWYGYGYGTDMDKVRIHMRYILPRADWEIGWDTVDVEVGRSLAASSSFLRTNKEIWANAG